MAAVAVALGATAQSATGIGFALVSSPFLVAFLGPREGIRTSIWLSLIINIVLLYREREGADWSSAGHLLLPAAIAMPATAFLARGLDDTLLAIIAGSLAIGGAIAISSGIRVEALRGRLGAAIAGTISGAMNALAAIGGPAAALYAINDHWPMETMRPTLQAYFVGLNIIAIAVLGIPSPSWELYIGTAAGWVFGGLAVTRLPAESLRPGTLGLAAMGGAFAIINAL